jgi:hypothetical protein
MKVKYMIELEVPAIVSSIINEIADYYMVSYANQLKNCKFPEDAEKIDIIINKILNWYAENIDKKANEDLFFNMKNHTKNKQVLLDLKNKINIKGGEKYL